MTSEKRTFTVFNNNDYKNFPSSSKVEQNSNKKTKLVSLHKKQQEQKKHASNCDDVNCKGCEVGEIEIVFTSNGEEGVNNEIELNPYQLFQLAQEEATSKVNNGGE